MRVAGGIGVDRVLEPGDGCKRCDAAGLRLPVPAPSRVEPAPTGITADKQTQAPAGICWLHRSRLLLGSAGLHRSRRLLGSAGLHRSSLLLGPAGLHRSRLLLGSAGLHRSRLLLGSAGLHRSPVGAGSTRDGATPVSAWQHQPLCHRPLMSQRQHRAALIVAHPSPAGDLPRRALASGTDVLLIKGTHTDTR